MTTQHARPLVAYICVAFTAALLLVAQGMSVPRHVTGATGVIGAVSSLDLGARVVLTPLQGQDTVAAVGGAVPRRVAGERSVIRAASPRPTTPRAAVPVRPRATAGHPGAARSSGPRTHQRKPVRAPGASGASRPGKSQVLAKGHARTSLRSAPRADRASQRGGYRAQRHGRALRRR